MSFSDILKRMVSKKHDLETAPVATASPSTGRGRPLETPPVSSDNGGHYVAQEESVDRAIELFQSMQDIIGRDEDTVQVPCRAVLARLPDDLKGPQWSADRIPEGTVELETAPLLEKLQSGRVAYDAEELSKILPGGWLKPVAGREVEFSLADVVSVIPPELMESSTEISSAMQEIAEMRDYFAPSKEREDLAETGAPRPDPARVELPVSHEQDRAGSPQGAEVVEVEAAEPVPEVVEEPREVDVPSPVEDAQPERAEPEPQRVESARETEPAPVESAPPAEEPAVAVPREEAPPPARETPSWSSTPSAKEPDRESTAGSAPPPVRPPVAKAPAAPRRLVLRPVPAYLRRPRQNDDWDGVERDAGVGVYTVDINRASAEELLSLPGVGEAIASRILAYRNRFGRMDSIYDLLCIPGIGPDLFNKMTGLDPLERKERSRDLNRLLDRPEQEVPRLTLLAGHVRTSLDVQGCVLASLEGMVLSQSPNMSAHEAATLGAHGPQLFKRSRRYLELMTGSELQTVILPMAEQPLLLLAGHAFILSLPLKPEGNWLGISEKARAVASELDWLLGARAIVTRES